MNVNVNVNANASASASARAGINARAGSSVYVQGGGGAYVTVDQPYPTTISGLMVEGAAVSQVVRVPFESRRRLEKRVVIQAVCIDDRSVPHPASQVRPDREVDNDYEGELYRCLAGTSLQITIAEYLGTVSFDHGETMSCRKHGVKILTMIREETYTEYRDEVVQTSGVAVSGASITLDGGVGGRVF